MSFENADKKSYLKDAPKAAVLAALLVGQAAEAGAPAPEAEMLPFQATVTALESQPAFDEALFVNLVLHLDLKLKEIVKFNTALKQVDPAAYESMVRSFLGDSNRSFSEYIDQVRYDVEQYEANWSDIESVLLDQSAALISDPDSAIPILPQGLQLDSGRALQLMQSTERNMPKTMEEIDAALQRLQDTYYALTDQPIA